MMPTELRQVHLRIDTISPNFSSGAAVCSGGFGHEAAGDASLTSGGR